MIKKETIMAKKTKALYTLTVQKGKMNPLRLQFIDQDAYFEAIHEAKAQGFAVFYDYTGTSIYKDAKSALEVANLFAR